MMKSSSVFHAEQNMEFEKFNCFFIDYLRFERIKVISTVVEREYKPGITWQICFGYQLTDFYMIRDSTKRYFLTDYSYIIKNHFYFVNAPSYCFNPSLSRIFCVNSSIKVFSPLYKGPSTHVFRTSLFCTFIIQRKKEIGFVAKLFSKLFFWAKGKPELYVFISSQVQESS